MFFKRHYPFRIESSENIRRIMIIGCGGSGKSTFSRKLGKLTGLPVTHLDKVYWKPNWEEPEKEEWSKKVEQIANKENWILDGNYSGTFPIRLARTDLVIWLDRPMLLCLFRVIKRSLLNWGKTRSDMGEGCKDRLTLEFVHYIARFPLDGRNRIIRKLANSPFDFEVVQLRKRKQIRDFLNELIST